jgi:5'-methylthioadenosine phosphorylase
MATDYDTWHPDHDSVTVEMVINNLTRNVQRARDTISALVPSISDSRNCTCGQALDHSIMTDYDVVSPEVSAKLAPLLSRVWG